jgi:2-methylcitrate dehydratase
MAVAAKAPTITGKPTARKLAELVHGIRFETLSADVIAETKRRVLDAIGCGLGGFASAPSQSARAIARDLGGKPEATIWGEAQRTSCDRATLANSTMLRYLDYMDSHAGPDACHPCFNIPPVLAMAERVGASGKDLIAAVVAGYEIQIRLQDSCVVGKRGWFSGMYLEFSVPLATGLLLGLDVDRLTQALAISVSHGNTLGAQSHGRIPSSKSIADGMVSSIGITAALMAERGVTGPEDVVESPAGFAHAIADRLDLDTLLAPAAEYRVMEVNTKWFNTVRVAQTAVTGLFGIMDKHDLTWRDIESLVIHLPTGEFSSHDGIWNGPSRLRPATRDSANHSPIYSVAVAAVDRVLGPEQYADAKLSDPDVLSVVDRTTLKADANLDKHWPAAAVTRMVLRTKDGRQHEATTLYAPGHHKNRVSQEQLQEKFTRLAGNVLDAARRRTLFQAVADLDSLKTVDELTRCLRAPEAG